MKTNQVVIPNELRKQRTKDGYLSATRLIEAWNLKNPENVKQLAQFKLLSSTKRFIDHLKKEGIEKPMISGRGKGENSGTWMHPKLFVDLAMWVSLEFKSMALGWIVDGLVQSRHDAGDYYNEMCGTILTRYVDFYGKKPDPTIYITEARRIKLLLGLSGKDRNLMTEKELNSITQLQKVNSLLISEGRTLENRVKHLETYAKALKM